MASLKRKARQGGAVKEESNVCLTDSVLEMSITVGYLGCDVKKEEIGCLDSLLREHCVAGLVALERGEVEDHLHFQMIVRARSKSARAFGILVRKYMGWFGKRGMNPVGKVTCKVLTNRYMHTFLGMVGYCLKDTGAEHFQHCMHNISDEDVIAGKTLHTIYGRGDCKKRVTLTNKNVTDRMYVWFKYRTNRKLTATFLSTLTEMIQSGIFIPSASWIIPLNGQGMDHKRMTSLWNCITTPHTVTKTDIQEVFVKKRNFVRGRYFEDDEPPVPHDSDDEGLDKQPTSVQGVSNPERKPSSLLLNSCLKPNSGRFRVSRALFEEKVHNTSIKKSVSFKDTLGDYVPLKDNAKMVENEYLNTTDAQCDDDRYMDVTVNDNGGENGEDAIGAGVHIPDNISEVIELSSDSEEDVIVCKSGPKAFFDRATAVQKAPRMNISKFIKVEPAWPIR